MCDRGKKKGSQKYCSIWFNTNDFIPRAAAAAAHTPPYKLIWNAFSDAFCAHAQISQQFSICSFWHFNYIPFSTILCILNESTNEWISSFSFPFSSIYLQVERKRHIGNDIVNIIFIDGDDSCDFSPNCIKSQFTRILFKWIYCLRFHCYFRFRWHHIMMVWLLFFIEANVFRRKLHFHSTWIDYNGSSHSIDWQNISILSHSFNSYRNMLN